MFTRGTPLPHPGLGLHLQSPARCGAWPIPRGHQCRCKKELDLRPQGETLHRNFCSLWGWKLQCPLQPKKASRSCKPRGSRELLTVATGKQGSCKDQGVRLRKSQSTPAQPRSYKDFLTGAGRDGNRVTAIGGSWKDGIER